MRLIWPHLQMFQAVVSVVKAPGLTIESMQRAGIVRLVSVGVLFLSIFGWVIFLVGFTIRKYRLMNVEDSYGDMLNQDFFPYWCFAIHTPILFVAYFLHLCWSNKQSQLIVLFCIALFFFFTGGVLYENGISLSSTRKFDAYSSVEDDLDIWVPIEFLGALCSIGFYWLSVMTSPDLKRIV